MPNKMSAPLSGLKVGPDDGLAEGAFVGYASVFNNRDLVGDVVRPGAFAKSLESWSAKAQHVPVLYGHNESDPDYSIGHVVDATEDARGLKVHCQLDLDAPKGGSVYRAIKGRRMSGMSFAYGVRQSGSTKIDGQPATELTELDLFEVSIVPRGANPAAGVTAVKHERDRSTRTRSLLAAATAAPLKGDHTMTTSTDRRAELVAELTAVTDKVRTKGADLDAEDDNKVRQLLDAIHTLDEHAERVEQDKEIQDIINGKSGEKSRRFTPRRHDGTDGGSRRHDHEGEKSLAIAPAAMRTLAHNLATKSADLAEQLSGGTKALLPVGASVTDSVTVLTDIVSEPRTPNSFLELLSTSTVDLPQFAYLRQTQRENNAAIVEQGAQKPTSKYGLERIEESLKIVAHLSEGIGKYDLLDIPALSRFLQAELQYGLFDAVEEQVLNGTGASGSMTGVLATSGHQTQAFDADILTTIRRGVTKLENMGLAASALVIRPEDWEALELSKASGSGEFTFASTPVDRAARTVWGVKVAVSNRLPVGKAVMFDSSSLSLYTDTNGVSLEWATSGDDFERNLVRARCEGRFGVAVTNPSGTVELATSEG